MIVRWKSGSREEQKCKVHWTDSDGPLKNARSKDGIVVQHPTDLVDDPMLKPNQEGGSVMVSLRLSEG